MSSTTTAHQLPAARPGSGPLDVAIAAVVFAGTLLLLSHGGISSTAGSRELDQTGVILAACTAVPLVAWRRFPLGVFVVTGVASVLLAGLGYPLDLMLGPAAALYLLAAGRESPTPWKSLTVLAVGGTAVAYLVVYTIARGTFPGIALMHTGLAWAAAWFAGERTRLRREHMADLRQRALRVEREAERERLLAAAEERARIARDLHDSAGHAISLIAVRAGAARLRHYENPDRSLQTLQAVEELARSTVEEIDQIVGTLRDGGQANGAVEDPPGLASLDTLIARHAAAGLRVSIETSGPPPRSLGAAADQAAYRILQEALTNAARHGAGRARIVLAFGDDTVELMITNPLRVSAAPRSGGGHGLIGMQERVTLLGGSLDTEQVNGAFRIRARLPYGGHRP